jgi:hypothetical protein
MKKVFLLIVSVASFATIQAQTKFGIKAGANLASLAGDDVDDAKMKIGFNVGGFAKIGLTESLSLQPELVFSAQGAKFEDEGDDVKYNLSYLNIPVLLQYNLPMGLNFEAGPQIGFLVGAKAKQGDEKADVKDFFKSTDFSLALGAGYLTKANIGFNARFNLGLGNIADSDDGDVKNSVIQVGVFYAFGGKK